VSLEELVTRALRGKAAYHVPRPPDIRAKLDANELPFALPPAAAAELGRELATVALHRYPEANPVELRAFLADDLGVAGEQLVFGNGSDELIALLCAAFGEPRKGERRAKVLYPDPSFVYYGIAARTHGVDAIEVPLDDDMQLDFELVEDAMRGARPNLAFFALPNNPTGTLWPPERVAELAVRFPDTLVVADEAYLAYGGRTLLPRLPGLPNLIVMRTLSKVGMAGLRVGFLVAAPALVADGEKVRPP
jgi:histidinol-phosphate aminotransferase